MEIPKGTSREDVRIRRIIIRDYYKNWFSAHPNQVQRNKYLNVDIHVKNLSMNETSGHASATYESTLAVFRLSEILENATLTKVVSPKPGNKNQKSFSKILKMRYGKYQLIVGLQKSNGHLVQYCVGAKRNK